VEVAAEPLLVAVAGDTHDHPVAVAALGEERECRGLAPQLVLGVVQVREVLDLRERQEAAEGCAQREPENRGLVEQRVEHARRTEALVQATGDAVDAALGGDVLAEQERVRVPLERVRQRGVDRLR
jgi:hypothetical protein